jgi:exopolysaccharide biosynthesis polyprenyl glycosylphosphotransferase
MPVAPGPLGRRGVSYVPHGMTALNDLVNGPAFIALIAAVDLVAMTLATLQARSIAASQTSDASHVVVYAFPLVGVLLIYARRGYRRWLRHAVLDDLGRLVGAISAAAMLVVLVVIAIDIDARPGRAIAPAWLLSVTYVVAGRLLLTTVQRAARTHYRLTRPAIIIGAGRVGAHVARRLELNPEYGLHPVAYLDSRPREDLGDHDLRAPVLGTPGQLAAAVELTAAKHLIVAFSADPDCDLLAAAISGRALGLEVSVVPRFFDSVGDDLRLDHLGGLPVMTLGGRDLRGFQFGVKHATDRVGACLMLGVLSPLLVVLAVTVKLSSPGPILLRQRRVGRDGCEFDLLKFRSMRGESGALGSAGAFRPQPGAAPGGVEGIDRRTHVGRFLRKTSLDELPQLINVLRGEMSLVGPRPERPEFIELFGDQFARYDERLRVKAGMTGWAQVHGLRGQTSLADRIEWDNHYIENWSLGLDLKILALTVLELCRWRGT